MAKTYTEHPYPLVAQWGLQNGNFIVRTVETFKHRAPELDLVALLVLHAKKMTAGLSGRRKRA